MQCYSESEPKRSYRKRMLTFWLEKCIFKATNLRLVDQINTIRKRKYMIELQVEEITRKLKKKDQVGERQRII